MYRRRFLGWGLAGGLSALAGRALGQSAASPAADPSASTPMAPPPPPEDSGFAQWLESFRAKAAAAGVPKTLVDEALGGLSPDPRITGLDARQPEIERPIGDYMRRAVTYDRILQGREHRLGVPQLEALELAYGVPSEILVAIWAMESRYGAVQGDFDILRSLATLAASGRRRAWAEGELIAALTMLARGDVDRARLRGSWAGAMGQTQIEPSTYLELAVDADGDGRKDVWGSPADALGSAANLLARAGWRRDQGWAREVAVPAGFDWGLTEGAGEPVSVWIGRGLTRTDNAAWDGLETTASAVLLAPAGAEGPAFLALPNHFIIRRYNNSIAYALAVGLIADGIGGAPGLSRPWPVETPIPQEDRIAAQEALRVGGFYTGQIDGVIGLGSRRSLRAWQKARGLIADGHLTLALALRLKAELSPPAPLPPIGPAIEPETPKAAPQTLTPS